MDKKEFAEKYAGRKVRLTASSDDIRIGTANKNTPIGIVVGYNLLDYYNHILCQALSPATGDFKGHPPSSTFKWSSTLDTNYETTGIFSVNVEDIELVIPIKPVIAYPHKCKICHSPARKCVKATLCSNLKCKSRRKIKKLYAQCRYVKCPKCDSFADDASSTNGKNYHRARCLRGHLFDHIWQKNECFENGVFLFTYHGGYGHDSWSWVNK